MFLKQHIVKLAFALFFFFANVGFAQEAESLKDTELWTGFVIKHKINKKLRFELEQQTRLNNNVSELKSTFFEAGLRYKVFEYLTLKPQLRYVFPNGKRNRYRISLDASTQYKFKKPPLKFYYRARFQHTKVTYTKQPITLLRNRIGTEYKFNKWLKAYTEAEVFYRFDQKNEFRGMRYTLGAEFRLNKNTDLNLYYQNDSERNVKEPQMNNIIGVKFSFSI